MLFTLIETVLHFMDNLTTCQKGHLRMDRGNNTYGGNFLKSIKR